ncbi:hypothetical protein GQ53DRAFT_316556 [Thozetella sp. PMI_491]|nr:hypothetical protein GQ53DRAFT_316556 [Thozetella sp. PMI_491]
MHWAPVRPRPGRRGNLASAIPPRAHPLFRHLPSQRCWPQGREMERWCASVQSLVNRIKTLSRNPRDGARGASPETSTTAAAAATHPARGERPGRCGRGLEGDGSPESIPSLTRVARYWPESPVLRQVLPSHVLPPVPYGSRPCQRCWQHPRCHDSTFPCR